MSIFTGKNKWWYIGFLVFSAVCLVLVVVGVLTHEEPGITNPNVLWPKNEFPLVVQATPYVASGDSVDEARKSVKAAIKATNERLGFTAYKYDGKASIAHVQVTVGVPQGVGMDVPADFNGQTLKDPGGAFLLNAYPGGKRWKECLVQTSNTGTAGLLYMVLQHELGHCLGLGHDDFESSIMFPVQKEWSGNGWPARITDFDRGEVRRLYAP